MQRVLRALFACASAATAVTAMGWHGSDTESTEVNFLRDVKPILAEKCLECHGLSDAEGGVRLDSRSAALADIDGYAAVVPGDREESEMWYRITAEHSADRMPPVEHGKPLTQQEIDTLGAWIDQGAPWQEHWGFADWAAQTKPAPAVKDESWSRTSVDPYVLARLEQAGLKPATGVDDATWLRRVYFDLIGLPPTAKQQDDFFALPATSRRAQTVEALLASPHFGEKWARHILDLVRYAETRGHEFDFAIPNAWEYRDYLVRALNSDVGWDQLITEHIAGDLLSNPRTHASEGWNESILGTGFWFLGEAVHSPVDLEVDLADRSANQIDVFGKAFLGLTVACARCHDHKFDPITAQDYYALSGFVQSASYRLARYQTLDANRAVAERLRALDSEQQQAVQTSSGDWLNRWLDATLEVADSADSIRPELAEQRDVQLVADFAQGIPADWQMEGEAFAQTLPHQTAKDDSLTGRLISPQFVIEHDALSFNVWGGKHPGSCCVNLIVDGEVALSMTGANSVEQREVLWRLDGWRGKSAHLEIVDQETGGWGHISVNQIQFQNLVDEHAMVEAKFGSEQVEPTRAWLAHPGVDLEARRLPITQNLNFDEGIEVVWSAGLNSAWWQDGASFDRRAPGWVLSAKTRRPELFLPWPAVVQDPDRRGLQTAALSAEESLGAMNWRGSGRTFKTATLRLGEGETWYLLRGKGVAFAPIEHHRILAGPLHQGTALRFDTQGEWQWVEHATLAEYAGLRTHIEFSPHPDDETPLAVAAVVRRAPGQLLPSVPTRSLAEELCAHPQLLALGVAAPPNTAAYLDQRQRLASRWQVSSRLAPALLDGNGHDQPLLLRGETGLPQQAAPRAFLSRFDATELAPQSAAGKRTSGRAQLAARLLESAEPLVARVFVNRVWHHVFGRGLAPQPDNFGVLAGYPSHPELLDQLAHSFARDGWQLKTLLRELVLSASYAQSSQADPQASTVDPENSLWHARYEKRLDAEAIRDALLTVSGELDPTFGGPSVPVHLTSFMKGRGRPGKSGPLDGDRRRTLYQEIRRNFLPPFLMVFDYPTPATTMGRRSRSNVPAQALAMMNDPFVREMAHRWASRIEQRDLETDEAIAHAWHQALGREPKASELQLASAALADPEFGGWPQLLHAIFNLKEFVYVR